MCFLPVWAFLSHSPMLVMAPQYPWPSAHTVSVHLPALSVQLGRLFLPPSVNLIAVINFHLPSSSFILVLCFCFKHYRIKLLWLFLWWTFFFFRGYICLRVIRIKIHSSIMVNKKFEKLQIAFLKWLHLYYYI